MSPEVFVKYVRPEIEPTIVGMFCMSVNFLYELSVLLKLFPLTLRTLWTELLEQLPGAFSDIWATEFTGGGAWPLLVPPLTAPPTVALGKGNKFKRE